MKSGQMMLITLLVLTIALTVALSLIGRATTDTAVTTQVEESARAFSAAEAGIEEALKAGSNLNYPLTTGVHVDATVVNVAGVAGYYELPRKTVRGDTATIWLVNHTASGAIIESPTYTTGTIDVCWSKETIQPAVEISVLYKESADGSYRVTRVAIDSDGNRRNTNNFQVTNNNGFTSGTCSTADANRWHTHVNFNNITGSINPANDTLIALRIKPLYSDATIGVRSNSVIPSQGKRIESTGTTATGITRKVVVTQDYRAPSGLFDYVVYSPGALGH